MLIHIVWITFSNSTAHSLQIGSSFTFSRFAHMYLDFGVGKDRPRQSLWFMFVRHIRIESSPIAPVLFKSSETFENVQNIDITSYYLLHALELSDHTKCA